MSGFDTRMRGLAGRLLDRFGGTGTLTRETSVYDPLTGSVATMSSTAECQVTIAPRTVVSQDGRLISQSVATLQEECSIGDGLTIGGRRFTIASVETVAPSGGEPVVYRAVITR